MENRTQLSSGLQKLLTETADETAQATGFVKRKRIVTGADFVPRLVFGLMAEPNATRHPLPIAYNRNSPKAMSAEGLDQPFTNEAVQFLKNMVENALQIGIESQMGNAVATKRPVTT
jgi:hypothetical protein